MLANFELPVMAAILQKSNAPKSHQPVVDAQVMAFHASTAHLRGLGSLDVYHQTDSY